MKRKLALGLILLASLAINLILMYGLSWNPFGYYFNQLELTSISNSIRTSATQIATIGSLVLIWGSFIYTLVKSFKTKRNNLLSLTISLMFLTGLLISNWIDNPEDDYSYTAETGGYEYIEKYWYEQDDTLFEKWKSVKPFNSKLPREQTEWKLIETNKK